MATRRKAKVTSQESIPLFRSKTAQEAFLAKQLQVNEAQLLQEFVSALRNDPEFGEAFTQADMELAIEDRDWIGGVGGMVNEKWTCDLQPQQRRLLVERSRMYWHRDPIAHQAVRLWTDYCFGDEGFVLEGGEIDQIQDFMLDPKNRNYFSAQGQKRLSNRLLVDGDLFLACFEDKTCRLFDKLQMELITDPDDEDIVIGYQRVTTKNNEKLYYLDYAYPDAEGDLYDPTSRTSTGRPSGKSVQAEDNVLMYRVMFDPLGKWGNGLLNTSTSWMSAHRRFMQARVNLLEALSKIAYKLTVKGGPTAVAAGKNKLQSTMVNGGTTNGVERNPPAVSASTYIGNAGADLQPMPRTTGAGDAKGDSDNLKLMSAAGTGIFLHYFGDPSTGNLATATAMELPMLKQFGAYQKLWKDSFRDICGIFLARDSRKLKVEIDLPGLLDDDLQKLGSFLTPLVAAFPEAKTESVLRECLTSMGVPDVDAVLKEAKANRDKIDTQNEFNNTLAAAKVGVKKDGSSDGNPNPNPTGGADYAEAVKKLDTIGLSIAKLAEAL